MKKGIQYSQHTGERMKRKGRPDSKGVTKATLNGTGNDVLNILHSRKSPVMFVNKGKYTMRPQYTATTSCLMDDEFIPERGKEIAKAKLMYRYNKDKLEKLSKAMEDLQKLQETLARQILACNEAAGMYARKIHDARNNSKEK